MGRVTEHELSQDAEAVLRRVTEGEEIVVTEHGEPKWCSSTYRPPESVSSGIEQEDFYTPPLNDPTPWPSQSIGPNYSDAQVARLIQDMREDR